MNNVRTLLQLSIGMVWLSSCGTSIDAGKNSRKHQEKVNRVGPGSEEEASQYEGSGSCFGTVKKLPPVLASFCEDVSAEDRRTFATIYKTLCEEKRLANLVLPECGWDGQGDNPQRAKYLKVLDSTAVDDPSPSFYYFSAYSLTLPKNNNSFKDIIFFAHRKPTQFDQEYGLPDNTVITPSEAGVLEKGREKQLQYSMELESAHGPSSFKSLLRGYTIGNNVDVVWDRALSGKRITMRRHLTLAFRLPDQRNKILIIEEREVDDQYAHKLARTVMKQFDLRRMEMYYDYAQIK